MKRLKLTQWREEQEEEQEEEQHSTKGDDQIGGMPNDVLSSILSLVPMKDAVKTSILSTRWRFLWASRPNLEFDFSTMLGTSITKNSIRNKKGLQLLNFEYVGHVDKLLQLSRAPKVYSFKVSYYADQLSWCHLDRWIEFAIAMGVELLEINLSPKPYMSYGFRSWYKLYNFPCLLLSHDGKTSSLKHLRLEFSILVCPPNFNGFNTLVTLDLHEVELNESCLESFFSSCLLLEILNMRSCKLPTNLKAVGPCVNLKCLDMVECLGVKKILISASKLTSFRYCGEIVRLSLSNVPWLKRLFIRFGIADPYVLIQLPKDLPRLESLYLSLTTEGDLISELPDDVLSSILFMVPLKAAVETSILSSRWRFLWTLRPNLEFDIHTMLGRSIPENSIDNEEGLRLVNSEYVRRVGNLLELYRAPKIFSFKVSYCIDQRSACHLDRWIKSAIALGVESLEINLSAQSYLLYGFRSWYKHYNFPCLLLSHDGKTSSLKHLRLEFSILVCPPNFNGFNTLVTLDLHEVELNESCLESFFSSCLLLEILNMRSCILPTNFKAIGPCVNLKCLGIMGCFGVQKILISASMLTSFRYCGKVENISLNNVPQLKRLFIYRFSPPKSMPFVLPKDLPGLESLFLTLTEEILAQIASYSSLKELELLVFPHPNLSWIISTIRALPLLLKLNLKLVDHSTKLGSTPVCPHTCLKEIEIYGFDPCSHMELVIYLLKNCVALERMIIDTTSAYYSFSGDLRLGEIHVFVGEEEVSLWNQGVGKEKFYEVVNSEVPGRGELVTIRK